jgi:hypothetical protein
MIGQTVGHYRIVEALGAHLPTWVVPLASVSLARALAASGDKTGAREAYQYFVDFWKRADADVPMLVEARREFAALK